MSLTSTSFDEIEVRVMINMFASGYVTPDCYERFLNDKMAKITNIVNRMSAIGCDSTEKKAGIITLIESELNRHFN